MPPKAGSSDILHSADPHNSSLLTSLNPAQYRAVTQAPDVPSQILAGPGSGKTKVLTSRIAYLILVHSIPPSSICAVTFTNKAAKEMKERLVKLIGKRRASEVKMGTFHALCAVFLRRYGKLVGLNENFTICDADEGKKIIATLLKSHKTTLGEKDGSVKESTILSIISKAKARGQDPVQLLAHLRSKHQETKKSQTVNTASPNNIDSLVINIYEQYERVLRQNNSLDFDDLLLFGVKLFTQNRSTIAWCRHVLVDEFQDTNVTQYELMEALAPGRCVTIVGDPDQSIYGWRSAEIGNLAKMRESFLGTEQIFLEQNYRSTAAILKASLAIVSQDKTRITKSLHTSHPIGITPLLRSFPTEHTEATFIAVEIKRVIAHMGGILRWGDFVILLRFNALSRAIESALQKEGIPSRILGGHKFFDRLEIKNILAYLQLVDNPNFSPALVRAINIPSRGIGEKTLQEILSRAERTGLSQLQVIEGICDNRFPDIRPAGKHKFAPFVKTIRKLRDLAEKGTSPAELIRCTVELVGYEDHLRKTQPDWESRWENVQELITFASEVETEILDIDQIQPKIQPTETRKAKILKETPLRLFLQASMLSSEGDNQNEEDNEKVTISTCHAAKGLEWPVVMIPAVERGTFPFHRTDDVGEERRLLYVACTRAQCLLYLLHTMKRKVAGETNVKELSEFVSVVTKQNQAIFTTSKSRFEPPDRTVISTVLGRPSPDDAEVSRRVAEFDRTMQHHAPDNEGGEIATSRSPQVTNPQSVNAIFFPNLTSSSVLAGVPFKSLGHQSVNHRALSNPRLNPIERTSYTMKDWENKTTLLPGDVITIPSPNENTLPAPALPEVISMQKPYTSAPAITVTGQGTKRRLGMGRSGTGYSNKKFKPPT